MKKLTFLALMLISLTSFAQNKFIEVAVTDTISLKPLNFQFNVYLDDDMEVVAYNDDEEFDPLAEKEKNKNKLQEIKKMLETKKYKVSPLDDSGLSVFERKFSSRNEGFTVLINGPAEMQKLKDLLDSNEDVKTIITVVKYADEQKAEEQLIKKLMDKARARATVIAINSQLKVGSILEVKESSGGVNNLEDFYLQIAKMGGLGKQSDNYTGSLSKTFIVNLLRNRHL